MDCDVIIFDCDGVLLDSNAFKVDSFRQVLQSLGYEKKLVEEFVQYHKDNGGISRYVKFKLFITDFLRQEFDEKLYNHLLNKFSEYCVKCYETASYTPKAMDFLNKNKSKIDYCVASGSDEDELKLVFKKRNIDRYFKEILGSPKTKEECVNQIVSQNSGRKIKMIGDAKADFLAAEKQKIEFIYMRRFSESQKIMDDLAKEHKFQVIETLAELLN